MSAATSRPRARKKPFNLEKTITKLRKVGRRDVPLADHDIPRGLHSVIEGGFAPTGPVDSLGDFEEAMREAKADPDYIIPPPLERSPLIRKVDTFFYRLGRTSEYVLGRLSVAAVRAARRYESWRA